jgi:hypothetical protein
MMDGVFPLKFTFDFRLWFYGIAQVKVFFYFVLLQD